MTTNFDGLPVLCSLINKSTVEGIVRKINVLEGTITLDSVSIRRSGLLLQSLSTIILNRNDVEGLQLLSTTKSNPVTEPSTPITGNNNVELSNVTIPTSTTTSSSTVYKESPTTPTTNNNSREESSPGRNGTSSSNRKAKVSSTRKTSSSKVKQVENGNNQYEAEGSLRRNPHASTSDNSRNNHRTIRINAEPTYSTGTTSNLSEYEEEFDFGAGLRSFDKAKIFRDIQKLDDTDPSLRLHAHNKNPNMKKLSINESVLSESELYDQSQLLPPPSARPHHSTSNHNNVETSTDDNSASEFEEVTPPPTIRYERRGTIKASHSNLNVSGAGSGNSNGGGGGSVGISHSNGGGRSQSSNSTHSRGFVTSKGGIKAVEVKLKQYKEVLSIADIETGPTSIQRTENAARGIASFILKKLSKSKSSSSTSRPSICILCDDCEKGTIALRAGVHLSNHNAKIVAFILTTDDHSERFRTNLREFSSAGGRIFRDVEDLSNNYDLLIDAIADNETQTGGLEAKSAADLSAALWASESNIPILSIDAPLGTDHDNGSPTTSSPLQPTYLVCLGAVRKGVENLSKRTEILLLDVGISPSLWNRVGVEDFSPATFGAEFVVALERI